MKKTINKILQGILKSKIYRYFMMNVVWRFRFSVWYPEMHGRASMIGWHILEPFDIIVCIDKSKATTKIIGGEWSHAALCVNKAANIESLLNPKFYEVGELIHSGYTRSMFMDICRESDRVAILRCPEFDDEYKAAMLALLPQFETSAYDIGFTLDEIQELIKAKLPLGVMELACSEFPYQLDYERRMQASTEDIECIGRPYISPTGLYKAKGLVKVFDSKNMNAMMNKVMR